MNEPALAPPLRKKRPLRFFRRNQSWLCFLGVLIVAGAFVVPQVVLNRSGHVQLREDFILLHERGETKASDGVYQSLIQGLAGLDERSLAEDLQRLSLIVDPKTPDKTNLAWRYYISVKKELEKRSEKRLSHILDHEGKQ